MLPVTYGVYSASNLWCLCILWLMVSMHPLTYGVYASSDLWYLWFFWLMVYMLTASWRLQSCPSCPRPWRSLPRHGLVQLKETAIILHYPPRTSWVILWDIHSASRPGPSHGIDVSVRLFVCVCVCMSPPPLDADGLIRRVICDGGLWEFLTVRKIYLLVKSELTVFTKNVCKGKNHPQRKKTDENVNCA